MDGRGNSIRVCGRGRVLRAWSTRRFIRCLVTESWATFFDTTTAYPCFPLDTILSFAAERTAVKCAEENRRPLESVVGNIARESRSLRGNTRIKRQDVSGRCDGGLLGSCGQRLFLTAKEIRGLSRAYAFSVDTFVWT